jgi:hypothetical protein
MYGPHYRDVKKYDEENQATWLKKIETVCREHAIRGDVGPYLQFRTDWINNDLRFAMRQTLRYVGFGYKNDLIFKAVGVVISDMLTELESKGIC